MRDGAIGIGAFYRLRPAVSAWRSAPSRLLQRLGRRADPLAVRAFLDRRRLALACVAFGSISIACFGISMTTPPSSSFPLAASELFGVSLPLTLAWFSFSGLCMLADETSGLPGLVASCSRFAGQAALFAGIPVWIYWYLHLVFRVV